MPKFNVTVTETTNRIFEVDAVNVEDAKVKVMDLAPSSAVSVDLVTRNVSGATRKLAPMEKVFDIQLANIRRDFIQLGDHRKLPDGSPVTEADAETMMLHLAKLHNALLEQSGLDLPKLGEGVVAIHLGDVEGDTPKPAKPKKVKPTASLHGLSAEEKQEIWAKAATKAGWHFDEDYKGWIKPENMKAGSRPGEWDAFTRDLTAEDACIEEDMTSLEEAVAYIEVDALS